MCDNVAFIIIIIQAILFHSVTPQIRNYKLTHSAYRIVSGQAAKIRQYPYQVSLERENNHFCGGSIISVRFILTAAHCVANIATTIPVPESTLRVRAGTSHSQRNGVIYVILRFIINERYGNNPSITEGDIALVETLKDIIYTHSIQPIEMAAADPKDGDECVVSGYGHQHVSPLRRDDHQLMYVVLKIMEREQCASIQRLLGNRVGSDSICAGGEVRGHKDACQGDSGGPLVVNSVLAGVVSWGQGCGIEGVPGVYTSVAFYREWIFRILSPGSFKDENIVNNAEMQKEWLMDNQNDRQYASGRGKPKPRRRESTRIVDGRPVDISERPHQVSMEQHMTHVCGAAIIHPSFVLTAAHCVVDLPAKFPVPQIVMRLRLGTSIRNEGGMVHQVAKFMYHKRYRSAATCCDIAVVQTQKPIIYSNTIQAVPLVEAYEEPRPGQRCSVSGYGVQDVVPLRKARSQLMSVDLEVMDIEQCKYIHKYLGNVVAQGTLCAGGAQKGHRDACQGDSGGALVVNGKLAGIVSWGQGCGQEGVPGVYTSVAVFREWVDRSMNTMASDTDKEAAIYSLPPFKQAPYYHYASPISSYHKYPYQHYKRVNNLLKWV